MSEQMEVKIGDNWHPCDYVSPVYADNWRIVVYATGARFASAHICDDCFLRPAPRTEPEAEGDGWIVRRAGGSWRVYHPETLTYLTDKIEQEFFVKGGDINFPTESLALAALAKWREQNNAKAEPKDEPAKHPLTREEEDRVREIVREMLPKSVVHCG